MNWNRRKNRMFCRFLSAACLCGFFMFSAYSAIFPGFLLEADMDMKSRLFIFGSSVILDITFTVMMYQDFGEYLRLKRNLSYEVNRIETFRF